MKAAAAVAATNVRDREAMKAACEDMDRVSAEIFQEHGVLDIGTPAIRELRDAE